MNRAPTTDAPELQAAYLRSRDDLKRFFTARLKSAAAAEDLIQDLYLKVCVWPADAAVENPSALLYRMGSNLMLDRLRTEQRAAARDGAWVELSTTRIGPDPMSEDASPERVAAARQRMARLTEGIDHLPPQTRRAFVLHKLEGLTHAETAQRLGVSQKTVEKQISAALRRLLAHLGDHK